MQTAQRGDDAASRTLFVLVSLVGNTVTAKTRSGQRFVGILHSTSPGDLGVSLSSAQEIKGDGTLGAPQKLLVINGGDLDIVEAHEVTLGEPVREADRQCECGIVCQRAGRRYRHQKGKLTSFVSSRRDLAQPFAPTSRSLRQLVQTRHRGHWKSGTTMAAHSVEASKTAQRPIKAASLRSPARHGINSQPMKLALVSRATTTRTSTRRSSIVAARTSRRRKGELHVWQQRLKGRCLRTLTWQRRGDMSMTRARTRKTSAWTRARESQQNSS